MICKYAPEGKSLTEELMADRRTEVDRSGVVLGASASPIAIRG